MVGNDIVDLKKAAIDSDWKRKGFLDKIFTAQEQNYINKADNAGQMVWLLWSMKESAYKIYLRSTRKRKFAPTKLSCRLTSTRSGMVNVADNIYYTLSEVTDDYIHTIADCIKSSEVKSSVLNFEKLNTNLGSTSLHNSLCEYISKESNVHLGEVKLLKDALNIPIIKIQGTGQVINVSLSHHGKYSAWCY